MKTIASSTPTDFQRRQLVMGILALSTGPSLAIAPTLLLIGPTLLAGILGIIGINMQVNQADRQHAEQMRLNDANLQLAHEQLLSQNRLALRQEKLAILTALLGRSDKFAEQFIGNNFVLAQNIALEPDRRPANGVLTENGDGHGTRIGLHRGLLAMERGGEGDTINNQNAIDLAAYAEDAIPLPVTGMVRDLNQKMAISMREFFARENGIMTLAEVDREWALAGFQQFSRAINPRGRPDIQAATFLPRVQGRHVKYAYMQA